MKRNETRQLAQRTVLQHSYLMGSDVSLHELMFLQQVGDGGQVLAVILRAQHLLHLSTQHRTPASLTC